MTTTEPYICVAMIMTFFLNNGIKWTFCWNDKKLHTSFSMVEGRGQMIPGTCSRGIIHYIFSIRNSLLKQFYSKKSYPEEIDPCCCLYAEIEKN